MFRAATWGDAGVIHHGQLTILAGNASQLGDKLFTPQTPLMAPV